MDESLVGKARGTFEFCNLNYCGYNCSLQRLPATGNGERKPRNVTAKVDTGLSKLSRSFRQPVSASSSQSSIKAMEKMKASLPKRPHTSNNVISSSSVPGIRIEKKFAHPLGMRPRYLGSRAAKTNKQDCDRENSTETKEEISSTTSLKTVSEETIQASASCTQVDLTCRGAGDTRQTTDHGLDPTLLTIQAELKECQLRTVNLLAELQAAHAEIKALQSEKDKLCAKAALLELWQDQNHDVGPARDSAQLQLDLQRANSEIYGMELEIQSLRKRLSNLEREATEVNEDRELHTFELQEKNDQIDVLQSEILDYKQFLEAAAKSDTSQREQVAHLEAIVTERDAMILCMESESERECTALKQQLDATFDECVELREQITGMQQTINVHDCSTAGLKKELATAYATIDRKEQELQELLAQKEANAMLQANKEEFKQRVLHIRNQITESIVAVDAYMKNLLADVELDH